MSPILLLIMEKFLLPLAISILQKSGVINGFEAAGIKTGTHVLQAVESIHTYPEYPGDPVTEPLVTTNLVTKDGEAVS